MIASAASVLAEISWNPEIRNILAVTVGAAILIGSVFMLLATNTGPRTGLLIALAGLMGWMTLMGAVWMLYGIGLKGKDPSWKVLEVNTGNLAEAETEVATLLPPLDEIELVNAILREHPELREEVDPLGTGKFPTIGELIEADYAVKAEFDLDPDDLGGWHILEPSNKQRGDAQAAADAVLGDDGLGLFGGTAEYKVLEAFDQGGKNNKYPTPGDLECTITTPSDCFELAKIKVQKTLELRHPPHYAIIQVQAVVPEEAAPGEAPPVPVIDEDAPIISVVMLRDLGDRRFPPFLVMVSCGILFAITCNVLHRRDKQIAKNRAGA